MRLPALMRLALALTVFLSTTLAPQPAHAWSAPGHELVARLAYERLSPAARAELNRLIAADARAPSPGCPITSIETLSTWSDCVRNIRSYANQSPWHYDNIPVCGAPQFDCAGGDCATAAIERAIRTLRNRRASDQSRVRALARLVHFVADIHQPLHASDNGDRGGNLDRVDWRAPVPAGMSPPQNLHGAWDGPIAALALNDGGQSVRALAQEHATAWQRGSPADWAAESNAIARTRIYSRWPEPLVCGQPARTPVVIDAGYVAMARPVVREQLARASVRLAATLEQSLGR